MISVRLVWVTSALAVFGVVAVTLLWPEIRGLCPSCAPAAITTIPSKHFVRAPTAADLDREFAKRLDGMPMTKASVPRIYVRYLPKDLNAITDTEQRKRIFTEIMLPQVLRLNEAIQADRARLIAIGQTATANRSETDIAWVAELAERYGTEPADRQTLLARVDVIPPSLALAQGAIESGWGTSRFATSGNALFGQRTFDPDRPGFRPNEVEDANFKVRRFKSLMRSIWGYMVTLNTHPAHREFRRLRSQMRRQGEGLDSIALAATLTRYSEERQRYVRLVQNVISANNFRELDDLRLTTMP